MSRTRQRFCTLEEIASPENLRTALREACRGKRNKPAVARFLLRREEELERLHLELAGGSWCPAPYRVMLITRPKRRVIAAAPFRDRVVHHALYRVMAPLFSRSFLADSYACLPGRGTHRAILCFQQQMQCHRYMLLLDVRSYFASIRWDDVGKLIARRVDDFRVLELVETILASGCGIYSGYRVRAFLGSERGEGTRRGLPIGNLTSQFFGNLVLDELDHRIKRKLKIPGYVRYMDDMALFADRRSELHRAHAGISSWLFEERGLALKSGAHVMHTEGESRRFLGYVVSRHTRRLSRKTRHRAAQRLLHAAEEAVVRAEARERLAAVAASCDGLLRFEL